MESWYYMVHYVYLCVMNCAVVSWTLSLGKEMFSGRFNSICGISMTQLFPLWLSMLGWNWEDRCGGWTFISYLVSLFCKKSNADSSLIFGANCPQFSMWGLAWLSIWNEWQSILFIEAVALLPFWSCLAHCSKDRVVLAPPGYEEQDGLQAFHHSSGGPWESFQVLVLTSPYLSA